MRIFTSFHHLLSSIRMRCERPEGARRSKPETWRGSKIDPVVSFLAMTSREQFSPLCDVHYTSMQRMMLEEDGEEIRSYHICERRDCTRVFRDSFGYSDLIEGQFDKSRAFVRKCPRCGAILYLAEVDQPRKLETWECPRTNCEFSEEFSSPAAR